MQNHHKKTVQENTDGNHRQTGNRCQTGFILHGQERRELLSEKKRNCSYSLPQQILTKHQTNAVIMGQKPVLIQETESNHKKAESQPGRN